LGGGVIGVVAIGPQLIEERLGDGPMMPALVAPAAARDTAAS